MDFVNRNTIKSRTSRQLDPGRVRIISPADSSNKGDRDSAHSAKRIQPQHRALRAEKCFKNLRMLIADGTESVAGQLKNLAIARPDPIAPRIHGAYGNFFQALCRFASENRDDGKVSDEEFAVSAHLAAPFSPGGLLILLKEPLRKHPWKSGVAKVVAECPTLASIKEGLKQAGNLSLQEEVSIIDRWPFLPQPTKAKPNKARGTKRLDQLLLNAICAKQPDVILCMGRVRDISTP